MSSLSPPLCRPRNHHGQGCLAKQDQSGGWGADEEQDDDEEREEEEEKEETRSGFAENEAGAGTGAGGEGEGGGKKKKEERRRAATHFWCFCAGKLAVQFYHDIMSVKGGGDISHYGDLVIPDGHPGMGSSIPGGPGCRGMEGNSLGSIDKSQKARRAQHASEATRRRVNDEAKVDALQQAVGFMKKMYEVEKAEADTGPDDVDRLTQAREKFMEAQKALNSLPEDCEDLVRDSAAYGLRKRREQLKALMEKQSPSSP